MSSDKVKKKVGRPARVPGEKLQRINLTLRPSLLYGLELIARQRGGVSLSQAAEFAIATTMRNTTIDGLSLLDIAEAAIRVPDAAGGPTERVATNKHVWRLLRTPERLRKPEENYILEVYNAVKGWIRSDLVDSILEPARDGFRTGRKSSEVAAELKALANSRTS